MILLARCRQLRFEADYVSFGAFFAAEWERHREERRTIGVETFRLNPRPWRMVEDDEEEPRERS